MILKAKERGDAVQLARYLLAMRDNDHVELHEVSGFISDDLIEAFREAEAVASGTRCVNHLFSMSFNPPQSARADVEAFEEAIRDVERRLGLTGQPRAIVFHEKDGRRHAHAVWSRIDAAHMRAITLSHYKYRLRDVSRDLFRTHGWDMPEGLRDPSAARRTNYEISEAQQARRVKQDPEELKAELLDCWERSDSRAAFCAALWERGFVLARGDRRGFVAVDAAGAVYSLSRWLSVKPKQLRARLGDESELPTVDEAQALFDRSPTHDPTQDATTAFEGRFAEFLRRKSELVARQREERAELRSLQETRHASEAKARARRLPNGLGEVWSRLTGRYASLVTELETDAAAALARDRDERQALIDRHLLERRALDREVSRLAAERLAQNAHRDPRRQTYGVDPRQPLRTKRDVAPVTAEQLKREPDLILDHVSEKRARFGRTEVRRALADVIGDDQIADRLAHDVMTSPKLTTVSEAPEQVVTTKAFATIETELSDRAARMARAGGFGVAQKHVARAIDHENQRLNAQHRASFSDEQIAAIEHVAGPAQLSAVVGLAGAGKSTLLSVARAAWEAQGIKVHGAALSGKAASGLEGASGIRSRTLASLEASWEGGYEPIGLGEVLVVDEAGMVGTRQLARVANRLQNRGCKLVLVGDPQQLQPIEAGRPFADVVEQIGAARLTDIRRQKADWQREASVDLAQGRTMQALDAYAAHGAVQVERNRDHAVAALVERYMEDRQARGADASRLALAHRRVDVHAINQAIRTARKLRGEITSEVLVETDDGPRAFAPGDRLLFTRNDRVFEVRNGMLGTVEAAGNGELRVRLDSDHEGDGRTVAIETDRFRSIDHGYAVSIHRAQGCTVDRSFVLSSRPLDENLAYVGMTRHREATRVFTTKAVRRDLWDHGTRSSAERDRG